MPNILVVYFLSRMPNVMCCSQITFQIFIFKINLELLWLKYGIWELKKKIKADCLKHCYKKDLF